MLVAWLWKKTIFNIFPLHLFILVGWIWTIEQFCFFLFLFFFSCHCHWTETKGLSTYAHVHTPHMRVHMREEHDDNGNRLGFVWDYLLENWKTIQRSNEKGTLYTQYTGITRVTRETVHITSVSAISSFPVRFWLMSHRVPNFLRLNERKLHQILANMTRKL